MELQRTEEAEANPKLGLPGQRGRRRHSGGREEGFSPSFVRSTRAMPRGLQRRGFLPSGACSRGWLCRLVGRVAGIVGRGGKTLFHDERPRSGNTIGGRCCCCCTLNCAFYYLFVRPVTHVCIFHPYMLSGIYLSMVIFASTTCNGIPYSNPSTIRIDFSPSFVHELSLLRGVQIIEELKR